MYFNAFNQNKNLHNERKELENKLLNLTQENKIESVTIHYEIENPSEYYWFGSSSVEPKYCHLFTCRIKDEQLLIENGAEYFNKFYQNII